MRAALAISVLPLVLAAPMPAAASAMPEFALQFGRTFGVNSHLEQTLESSVEGVDFAATEKDGGFTAALSALWPWEKRFRFGVGMFISDLSSLQVTGFTVTDTSLSDVTTVNVGTLEPAHIAVFGGSWRVDVIGPELAGWARSFLSATYGIYRLQADQQGTPFASRTAMGGSLSIGAERAFSPHHALALAVGGNHVFNEQVTKGFGSATLEWRWRP
jgi:hypothetical protein